MVQFIQDLFLSPFLIMVMLLIVFALLTQWALRRRKEYIGYGLGWLIGVFVMVVYGALNGSPPAEVSAQDVQIAGVTLNIFQVLFPSFIGLLLGAGAMALVNQSHDAGARQSIVVALLTATALIVLFLMIVSTNDPASQRMIGLFALAFAIGAVTMMVIFRQTATSTGGALSASAQGLPLRNEPDDPIIPGSDPPVNRIRDRIDRRRRG